MPVGLKPFKSSPGSGRNWKRSTGSVAASVLDWSSGVSFARRALCGREVARRGRGSPCRAPSVITSSLLMASMSRPSRPMWRTGRWPPPDTERVAVVGDDLARRELDAPGSRTACSRFELGGAAEPGRALALPRGSRPRVDENQRPAAAQHELVDRVQRRVVEHRGMHDPEHVDVVVDLERRSVQRAHVEELARLLDDHPRLRRLLRLRVEAAADRRAREQPDDRLLRVREVVDEPREVVLEERLFRRLGLEERDRVGRADAVRAREAEVDASLLWPTFAACSPNCSARSSSSENGRRDRRRAARACPSGAAPRIPRASP